MELYNKFSTYLVNRYGEKTYKIPINIPVTCPNRDGTVGNLGCIFCGEDGAGFEMLDNCIPVEVQLERNIAYIGEKYNSRKFIAYFQNFTNTYVDFSRFREYVKAVIRPDVVAVYISTRPDVINDRYMEFLRQMKEEYGVDVVIELGLQTVNIRTLKYLERGHDLAQFLDAVLRIKRNKLSVCAHMILDIPKDNMDDVVEGARVLSALGVDQVKCHSMYILEGTKLAMYYKSGDVVPVNKEEYIDRVINFLENLSPDIVVQRLLGRAPKEDTLFCNWDTSWWKIRDEIEEEMQRRNSYQGRKFDYLNGIKILGSKVCN